MFNSTHTLVGVAVARTGLGRWTPDAVWTAVIASNLPDIDILTELGGTANYLDHHRGITHSILAVPVLSFALAVLMWRISRGTFWKHFVVALIAMSTHPLLDFANNYGWRPFLPFSGTWYYGDTLFIIDPYLDLLLAVGIYISYRSTRLRTFGAVLALSLSLIYIGARLELKRMAQAQEKTSAVLPQMLNPFVWTGIVDAPESVSSVSINLLDRTVTQINRLSKSPDNEVTAAAEKTDTARIFRNFTRFPLTRVEQTSTGYRVLLIDFRFYREEANTALAAEILLDRSLHIESQSISFTAEVSTK